MEEERDKTPEPSETPKIPDPNLVFVSRREFVKGLVVGAAAAGLGTAGVLSTRKGAEPKKETPPPAQPAGAQPQAATAQKPKFLGMVVVDYNKCVGCRICETECARFHYNNEPDLEKARIKVYYYNNPPVDVPQVCFKCSDTPCIKACPVEGAIYKHKDTGAVIIDEQKCIGCKLCIPPCSKDRTGVIWQKEEKKPVLGICNLCDGDPSCVKNCPEKALSYVPVYVDGRYFAAPHKKIADAVVKSMYKSAKSI